MKKCTYLILVFAWFFVLVLNTGCDQCKDIECPQDKEFPDHMERRIPYQVGQVVRFANAGGDTLILTCEKREYPKQTITPDDRIEEGCCNTAGLADNLVCNLKNSSNDLMGFLVVYSEGGWYITTFSLRINGIKYSENDYDEGHTQDSVLLNGKVFYNLIRVDQDSIFSIYNSLDGLGVVGFKIDGEEWALIE